MSSLWTPGGERPVGRPSPEPSGGGRPQPDDDAALDALIDDEAAEAVAAPMAEGQRRVAQMPPDVVIANHAMGCYELAAIHLSQQQPNLPAAALAIDAMGALVEGLAGRLGEAERTLVDALSQIRLAFVQIKAGTTGTTGGGAGTGG